LTSGTALAALTNPKVSPTPSSNRFNFTLAASVAGVWIDEAERRGWRLREATRAGANG